MKGKVKIGLNMLLMIIVLGVIFYVMDNSLSDIFAQLMETSWLVLIAVIFFGVVYQFAEGRSIKEIARYFNKDFTTVDGFFTSCYVALFHLAREPCFPKFIFIRKREFLFLKVWG